MFITIFMLTLALGLSQATTGLNYDQVLPLPKPGNAYTDIFGNGSLFLKEALLGADTGIVWAYIYASSFTLLLLMWVMAWYLITHMIKANRNPFVVLATNISWFVLLLSATITSWFLPAISNVYFFTLTALLTFFTFCTVVWMLYIFFTALKRYRKIGSWAVVCRGKYALLAGDQAISLCRPEPFIMLTKSSTNNCWSYDGIPIKQADNLMLVTPKGCYPYTRITTALGATPTKAQLYKLASNTASDLESV